MDQKNFKLLSTALILLTVALSTQEQSLDFILNTPRNEDDPVTWNLIEFRCRMVDERGDFVSTNSTLVIYSNEIQLPLDLLNDNGIALVVVNRSLEGNYTCRLGDLRSRAIRIVGKHFGTVCMY